MLDRLCPEVMQMSVSDERASTSANQVILRGRVTRAPQVRDLPSGASISVFRISVPRQPTQMTKGSRQRSDWFDCTAWTARTRKRVSAWACGDDVEVEGAVRRRHVQVPGGGTFMVDIEVMAARRVRATQSAGADVR